MSDWQLCLSIVLIKTQNLYYKEEYVLKNKKLLCKGFLLILIFLCCTILAVFGQECGDTNNDGSITIIDALRVAQYYVGLNPSGFYPDVADVNCEGGINILDALLIAQYYVGLIDQFPCSCGSTQPTPPPCEVDRVSNPWSGSTWYIDPVWSQKASDAGGSIIANNNTCVWMDRIGAITDGIGLRGHMDECLAQGANLIMIAIYNVPNRDCAASASNGELLIAENGFYRYCHEYIDPIVAILGDPAYCGIRIVCVLEQDSLANLVTNLDIPKCAEANGPGGYVDCIRYPPISYAHSPIPTCMQVWNTPDGLDGVPISDLLLICAAMYGRTLMMVLQVLPVLSPIPPTTHLQRSHF
jgi:hypothetical protein